MLELLCMESVIQPSAIPYMLALYNHASPSRAPLTAGFIFAGMAVVGFLLIMPASVISDRLGRKWTIVPSCIAIASACVLMAATGESLRLATILNTHVLCKARVLLPPCEALSESRHGSGSVARP